VTWTLDVVLIGGKNAGRRVNWPDDLEVYRVLTPLTKPTLIADGGGLLGCDLARNTESYSRRILMVHGHCITFGALVSISDLEAVYELIRGYREKGDVG
jgi:hypothetical protein